MAKIVVCDDEANIRGAVMALVGMLGHEVTGFADGEELLDNLGLGEHFVSPLTPDLLILDIRMPKQDGFSVLARLQADERCRKIPVIILTSQGKTKELFQLAGVSAFLEKPFDPEALQKEVQRFLP